LWRQALASVVMIGECTNANARKAFREVMKTAVVYDYFPAVSKGDDAVVRTEPKAGAPE
jgi:cobalamin-dependent methionine synthase I